jgi:hypothetical protein
MVMNRQPAEQFPLAEGLDHRQVLRADVGLFSANHWLPRSGCGPWLLHSRGSAPATSPPMATGQGMGCAPEAAGHHPQDHEARSFSSAASIGSLLRDSRAGMADWRSCGLASNQRPDGVSSSTGVIATVTRPVGDQVGSVRLRFSVMSAVKEKQPIAPPGLDHPTLRTNSVSKRRPAVQRSCVQQVSLGTPLRPDPWLGSA